MVISIACKGTIGRNLLIMKEPDVDYVYEQIQARLTDAKRSLTWAQTQVKLWEMEIDAMEQSLLCRHEWVLDHPNVIFKCTKCGYTIKG